MNESKIPILKRASTPYFLALLFIAMTYLVDYIFYDKILLPINWLDEGLLNKGVKLYELEGMHMGNISTILFSLLVCGIIGGIYYLLNKIGLPKSKVLKYFFLATLIRTVIIGVTLYGGWFLYVRSNSTDIEVQIQCGFNYINQFSKVFYIYQGSYLALFLLIIISAIVNRKDFKVLKFVSRTR